MSWDAELDELLVDEVTLAAPGAKDFYTQQSAGASSDLYRCKIDGRVKMIRDLSGREQVSTVQVYLNQLITGIDPTWVITLPARYAPTQPPILLVETFTDEEAGHHTVIHCGRDIATA
jgi:hypothetical protein